MAFREIRFPDFLAYGASGGPGFRTHIVVTKNGNEQRNQAWRDSLAVYTIDLLNRDVTVANQVRRFYRSVARGDEHGFRFHDHLPGEDTGTLEVLGTGNGVQVAFQLVKHYTLGAYNTTRIITKPVAGSVTVQLNGTPTGAFTVDTTTGVVTMTAAPAGGVVVTASFTFDVPCRFDVEWLAFQVVQPGVSSWASVRLLETRAIA